LGTASTTFSYDGVLTTGKHAYVTAAYDATGIAAKPVKGSFTVKAARTAVSAFLLNAGVDGTAKTDWLIDYNGVTSSTNQQDSAAAVFADYY
jgi:hypothetical protein